MPSLAGQGPFFDELAIGQEFTTAPAVTLSAGLAAAHQAITGDRLALTLDHELCRDVTGGGPLSPPVLDFWRCAMLPLRDPAAQTGHADDLELVGRDAPPPTFNSPVSGWRLDRFAR